MNTRATAGPICLLPLSPGLASAIGVTESSGKLISALVKDFLIPVHARACRLQRALDKLNTHFRKRPSHVKSRKRSRQD
jgi:hypothetical protein